MYKISHPFENYLDSIIEAFTYSYGEEYKEFIENKIRDTFIFQYNDHYEIQSYSNELDYRKRKIIKNKFIEAAGLDKETCDDELYVILGYNPFKYPTIDIPFLTFENGINTLSEEEIKEENKPIEAIEKDLLGKKLKIINFYLKDQEPIDDSTIKEFEKTDKYKEILEKIKKYIEIYKPLKVEYNEFLETLKPYDDYYNEENELNKQIKREKENKVLSYVLDKLPLPVIELIKDKTDEEKYQLILSFNRLEDQTPLELFTTNNINKLKNPKTDLNKRSYIMAAQSYYFKKLGLDKNDFYNKSLFSITKNDTSILDEYIKEFEEKDYRKYAPSDEDIKKIARYRKTKYNEYKKEYLNKRQDVVEIKKWIDNEINHGGEGFYNYIRKTINNKEVCILGATLTITIDGVSKECPLMLYTARRNDCGFLDYDLMHEFGHAIDKNPDICGIDNSKTTERNPYNKQFRKYERMNEALNDLFTRIAYNYLKEKDINFIEDKEFTLNTDVNNYNSFKIVVDLLRPLYDNYRKELIEGKTIDPSRLSNAIGIDNYEALNDEINKVDQLLRDGVFDALENNETHPKLEEYNTSINRINEIYQRIIEYRNSKNDTISIRAK